MNRQGKWTIDETVFDIIDTEEKAYFLGLMYADGFMYKDKKGFILELQDRDKGLVEEFRNFLKTNKPLRFRAARGNTQSSHRIDIYNDRLYFNLIELGCIPQKSLTITFPDTSQVPRRLLNHFVRGYFDGDGGISINEKGHGYISFCVSESFGNKLLTFLRTNVKCICEMKKHGSSNIYIITIAHLVNMKFFGNWLYQDATIFLSRKKEKFALIKCPDSKLWKRLFYKRGNTFYPREYFNQGLYKRAARGMKEASHYEKLIELLKHPLLTKRLEHPENSLGLVSREV